MCDNFNCDIVITQTDPQLLSIFWKDTKNMFIDYSVCSTLGIYCLGYFVA